MLKVGLDNHSIDSVANGLCETSLRGVDSHGIRLLPHYVNSAINGRKNSKPKFIFHQTFPSIGYLDADNGFGHAAGMKAIDHCMEMAKEQGIGIVGVTNSSHPGAMASMALKAANNGYIAFAFTHADSLLLSHGGKRPYFGTNPLCFAVPRKESDPYCLDMATSMISWNKLLSYRSKNIPLENNLAADKDGFNTNNANEASSLLPAGSYKGYGLASMVEILCGIYTGMNFGHDIASMYGSPINRPRKLGQLYMVMRVDGVINEEDFLSRVQKLSEEVRNEPSLSSQKVMMPNDPEIKVAKIRKKSGIPIDTETLNELNKLSKKYSVILKVVNK